MRVVVGAGPQEPVGVGRQHRFAFFVGEDRHRLDTGDGIVRCHVKRIIAAEHDVVPPDPPTEQFEREGSWVSESMKNRLKYSLGGVMPMNCCDSLRRAEP